MEKKLKEILSDILELELDEINSELTSDTAEEWDSLNHMNLIVSLEEEFNISIDEDIIPELNTYQAILKYLNGIE